MPRHELAGLTPEAPGVPGGPVVTLASQLRFTHLIPLDVDDFEGPLGRGLFTQAVVGQPPETNSI